jgi:hypothetical protein
MMNFTRSVLLPVLLIMWGCSPPPPPPPPPVPPATATGKGGTLATGVTYSVTVNPVGPTKWTYKVTGSSTSPFQVSFNSVQVHSLGDISRCSVTALPTPSSAFVSFSPASTDLTITSQPTVPATWWTAIEFTLECDKANGNVHLFFIQGTNSSGQVAGVVVGPIAGPQ